MKRLILPACVAAFFHALFFLMPMPPAPVVSPSAATHGTTINVTMTVPHVHAPTPVKPKKKPEPVKEKPKKKKKNRPRKPKPQPVAKKKVPKSKPESKVVEPVKELIQPPPEPVVEPSSEPEEPHVTEEAVAEAQEIDAKPEETRDALSAPAVGGVQAKTQPASVYAPEPRYPIAAIRRGYEGVVLLDILVNGKGEVKDVKVKQTSGHSVLDRSAVKGVKKWRFSATGAMDDTWVSLPVRFELRS